MKDQPVLQGSTIERGVQFPLSILIVNYRTPDLVVECVRSIRRFDLEGQIQIIVVDNNSGDNSLELLSSAGEDILLVSCDTNVGFGAANNIAAEFAMSDWLLCLNPDTTVIDNGVNKLLDFAKRNGPDGIYGGLSVTPEGEVDRTCAWGMPTGLSTFFLATGLSSLFPNSSFFCPESMPGWDRDVTREVDIVTGCFLLTSQKVWQKLGGYDALFFMYSEEADLCYRAKQQGIPRILYVDASVIHIGGASESIPAHKLARMFRGRAQFIHKHWHGIRKWAGLASIDLWVLLRCIAFTIASIASEKYKADGKVWRDVWRKRSDWRKRNLPQRRQINRTFVENDGIVDCTIGEIID